MSLVDGEEGVVLGVLIEVPEDLHPGLHCSRLRILLRVKAPIRLRDGLRSVRGKIIPEMLKVDALPARDKCKGRRAIEMKMPEIFQEKKSGRVANTRDEGIHQGEPIYFCGILRGVGVGHHQTDVVASHPCLLNAERLRQRVHVLRHRFLVISGFGLGGIAEAAQVRCHHEVRLRQFLHQRTPHVAVLRVAVKQDHGVALSSNQVVELHTIDVSVAVGDHRSRIRFGIAGQAEQGQEQYSRRISREALFHRHCGRPAVVAEEPRVADSKKSLTTTFNPKRSMKYL